MSSHSAGLEFMMRHRREVASTYMDLLRSLGGTLGEKEKQLIMIAIHTINRTPEALNIHITRAHGAGASVDEMIDAAILTLPVAGLMAVSQAIAHILKTTQVTPEGDKEEKDRPESGA